MYCCEKELAFYNRDDGEPRETSSRKNKMLQAPQNDLFTRPIGSWKKLVNYTRFGYLSFVILAPHENSYERCSSDHWYVSCSFPVSHEHSYDSGQVEVQPVGAGDPRYNLAYAILMMPDKEAFLFARAPTKPTGGSECATEVVVWLNWFPLEADPEMADILCQGVHVSCGCFSEQRKWKYPVEQALKDFDRFTYCFDAVLHGEPSISPVIYPLVTENDIVYLDPSPNDKKNLKKNYKKNYVAVEYATNRRLWGPKELKESRSPRLTSSEMKLKLLLRFFWHDSSPLSVLLCAHYFSFECHLAQLPSDLMYLILFKVVFLGNLPDWSISRVLSSLSVEAASARLGRPVSLKECVDAKEGEVCFYYCPPGLNPGPNPRLPRRLSPIEQLTLSQEAAEFLASPWTLSATPKTKTNLSAPF